MANNYVEKRTQASFESDDDMFGPMTASVPTPTQPQAPVVNPNDLVANPYARTQSAQSMGYNPILGVGGMQPLPFDPRQMAQQYAASANEMAKLALQEGQLYDTYSNDIANQTASQLANLQRLRGDTQNFFAAPGTQQATQALSNADIEKQASDLRRNGFNQKFQEIMADLDKEYDEIASNNLDPNRFFNNMSSGRQFIGGLGLLLSAATPNSARAAVGIIDKAIERDLQAQRDEINMKTSGAKRKMNKLQLLTEKYNSDVLAENSFRMLSKQLAKDKLEGSLANIQGQKQAQNIKMGILKFQNDLNQLAQKQRELINNNMAKAYEYNQASPVMKRIIQRWPNNPKLQIEAMKEVGEKRLQEETIATINKTYDEFKNGWGVLKQYSPFSTAWDAEKNAKSMIMGSLVKIWKGPMSEADEAKFLSLLPKFSIPDNRLEEKKRSFLDLMKQNLKPTPLLDEAGIMGVVQKELPANIKGKEKGKK